MLEGGQVAGDDAEQVVGVTEEPLGLQDVGDGGDSLFEGVDGVAVCGAHGGEDECLEGQAESVGVEMGAVAADGAGLFQGSQAAVAGRKAEADALGEFGNGQAPVLLEFGKDLPIQRVHVDNSSSVDDRHTEKLEAHSAHFLLIFPPNIQGRGGSAVKERSMAGGTVTAFWAVSFLFVVTPGADWAYAIAAGLRHRVVLPAVGGLLAGHLVATAVVAAGVGALVARLPLLLTVLTLAGALYLVWLGTGTLARPAVPHAGIARRPGRGAAGDQGRWHQRAEPEGVPAVPRLAAAVRRPERAWPI